MQYWSGCDMMNIWSNYSPRVSSMDMLTLLLVLLFPATVSARLPPGARKYQNFVTILFHLINGLLHLNTQRKYSFFGNKPYALLLWFLLIKEDDNY